MDDGMPELRIGDLYAKILLEKWIEIVDLREDFRFGYMEGTAQPEVLKEYVSRLTSLYGELYPKVNENVQFKDLQSRIDKFQPHYFDPMMLIEGIETKTQPEDKPKNFKLVFELDELLREIMEKLRITQF